VQGLRKLAQDCAGPRERTGQGEKILMKHERVSALILGLCLSLSLGFNGTLAQTRLFSASAPRSIPQNQFEIQDLQMQSHGSSQSGKDENPRVLLRSATRALQANRLNEAETLARTFLAKEPAAWEGHFLLGMILFRQGRAAESLAEYTEGAKHHDPEAEDLKVVALDYVLLNDYQDAEKWLTKSLTWNPNDAEAWYYLGRTKYIENRFEEAIAAFERCLRLENRNVKAKSNLGLSLAGLGRTAQAQAAYREAIAWQTDLQVKVAEPYIDLGDLLLDQNQTEDSILALTQAQTIAPEEPRVPELLGKALWRQNKFADARIQLEKAVKLTPGSAADHYLLGQVYRKLGMSDKAKSELDVAAALSNSHNNSSPK
jgi:tetratricopeptide (TPR) repeat protein